MKSKKPFVITAIWFLISIGLTFLHDLQDGKFNGESITRLIIIGYFLITLIWFHKKGKFLEVKNPKKTFVLLSTFNAMMIEVFHMTSKPLDMSLLITSETSLIQILKNTAIDLILTLPAYIIIFLVMWQFIKSYKYSTFSFFLIMGLSQSLGDGQAFFILNPVLLILIPYVMINYWSMNFIPYLIVIKNVQPTELNPNKFKKIILPLIIIPITYFLVASIILNLGKLISWLPY